MKVRERLNRIIIHTDYVQNVCKKVSKNGDDITKVILLDHMDWLDENEIYAPCTLILHLGEKK